MKKSFFYDVKMLPQPTETTCGPTCLYATYAYLGNKIELQTVIDDIKYTEGGGTLGVHLGIDALNRGYQSSIYTHNLNVFDPTWFDLSKSDLIDKLEAQIKVKADKKIIESSLHYVEFLKLGGKVMFQALDAQFLHQLLEQSGPVICGLSATYLYWSRRELNDTTEYDDIRGYPQGHFVVMGGISSDLSTIDVFDPLEQNPIRTSQRYTVNTQHFINSLLVGVITYDSNLITIQKRS